MTVHKIAYRAWIEEVVAIDGRDFTVLRPRDSEELLDGAAFADDEFVPYWADLWPSATALARAVAGRRLRGRRVLELGCGLGLPSVVAGAAGADVVASDWAPDAVGAAAENARRNDVELETVACDWRAPDPLLERAPFDLVLAADVLYERRNVAPLVALLDALGAETWLADPGRAPCEQLLADLELAGWRRSTLASSAAARSTVHRLTPP